MRLMRQSRLKTVSMCQAKKGNTLSAVNHEATNHQSSTSRIRRDKRKFLMDWDPESNPPLQTPNASSANARRSSVSTAWHPNRNEAPVSHCFNINYGTEDQFRTSLWYIQYLSFDWIVPLNGIFDVERRFVMLLLGTSAPTPSTSGYLWNLFSTTGV